MEFHLGLALGHGKRDRDPAQVGPMSRHIQLLQILHIALGQSIDPSPREPLVSGIAPAKSQAIRDLGVIKVLVALVHHRDTLRERPVQVVREHGDVVRGRVPNRPNQPV